MYVSKSKKGEETPVDNGILRRKSGNGGQTGKERKRAWTPVKAVFVGEDETRDPLKPLLLLFFYLNTMLTNLLPNWE